MRTQYDEILRQAIENKVAQIAVVGLGYVGLPLACRFAETGFQVVGIDVKEDKIAAVNSGRLPIEGKEPGLGKLRQGRWPSWTSTTLEGKKRAIWPSDWPRESA